MGSVWPLPVLSGTVVRSRSSLWTVHVCRDVYGLRADAPARSLRSKLNLLLNFTGRPEELLVKW